MERFAKITIGLAALLTFSGCALAPASSEDELLWRTEDVRVAVGTGQLPTTLTMFSEAGFWGTRMDVSVVSAGTAESVRLITTSEVRAAGLENRISSVQLACGDRDADIVMFWDWNDSSSLADWSPYAHGRVLHCAANTTAQIELHAEAPELADRLASVYLVRHTTTPRAIEMSFLVESIWNEQLTDLPDGAEANGDVVLTLRGSTSFDARQNLRLDSFWCSERGAHFEVRAQMAADATWTASVVSTYVDTGTGDSWGCRSEMIAQLDSAAHDAATELAAGLNGDLRSLAGVHPRHYLVPEESLHFFRMISGGEGRRLPVLETVPVIAERSAI